MKTFLTLVLGAFLFASCATPSEETTTTEETTVVETEEVVATDSVATETAPEAEVAQ